MVILALAPGLAACGDSDSSEDTIPLSEWVDEFDQICLDTIAEVVESDPDLTDDEFEAIVGCSITAMRPLPEPDEMAETAAELLDAISSDDENLDDAAREALDQRLGTAFNSLGVSEACRRGVSA